MRGKVSGASGMPSKGPVVHQPARPVRKLRLASFPNVRVAGEPLVLLKVRCPSTSNLYTPRVPPAMRRARPAVAWTFGMAEEEFQLAQES